MYACGSVSDQVSGDGAPHNAPGCTPVYERVETVYACITCNFERVRVRSVGCEFPLIGRLGLGQPPESLPQPILSFSFTCRAWIGKYVLTILPMLRWSAGTLRRCRWPRKSYVYARSHISNVKESSSCSLSEIGTSFKDGIAQRKKTPAVKAPPFESLVTTRRADEARLVLRSLLRECTYLPDSFARDWTKQYILHRFRKYGFKAWQHRDDSNFDERLQEKLREARAGLGLLRRANEGERKPLLKVLLMAYGRAGKRRHELMMPLMPTKMPKDLTEAVEEADGQESNDSVGKEFVTFAVGQYRIEEIRLSDFLRIDEILLI